MERKLETASWGEEGFYFYFRMVERRRRKLETGGWLRRNKTRTRGTSRTDEFSTSDTQRKVTALWSGKVISVWRRQVAERRALMKEKSGLTGLGQTFTSTSSLFSALIQHPVCSLMAGCERLSDRFDLNPSGWYQQPVWAHILGRWKHTGPHVPGGCSTKPLVSFLHMPITARVGVTL